MSADTTPLRITWAQAHLITQAMMELVTPEDVQRILLAHGIEVIKS